MKKDQYFNLEVNLLNDDNIASMMSEMNAAEALGIYVILLLHLRTKDAYEASCKPVLLKAMARRYDVDEVAGCFANSISSNWMRNDRCFVLLTWIG